MYSETKILQLFPKGQGGDVFVKTSPAPTESAGYRMQAGEGLGILWSQVYIFCLRVSTEMCGGATAAVLTWELAQMFLSFKERCFPPFLESDLLGHDLSLPRVACCS